MGTIHHEFMAKAVELAETALASDETPVGAVFVLVSKEGSRSVVAGAMNDTNRSLCGTRHAEFVGIEEILRTFPASVFTKIDLYVTVEPCVMCASALRQLHIHAVYFGCANDRFGGCGTVFAINTDPAADPPFPAYPGYYREEAIMLLRRFYLQENEKAPVPKLKKNRLLKKVFLPLDLTKYVQDHELVQLQQLYGDDLRKMFSSSPGLSHLHAGSKRTLDGNAVD